MIVIGLGTGRCGTASLATILDAQPGAHVTHERRPLLPWQPDRDLYHQRLADLREDAAILAGDVAPYYLPYVPWLLRDLADARFICLERARSDVVASFFSKTGRRNHWIAEHGDRWRPDPAWDPCFPTYALESKAAAVGRYWDEYHERASALARAHPDRFRLFTMDAVLNHAEGQARLLDFLGLPPARRRPRLEVHENRAAWPRRLKGWLRRRVFRW